MYKYISIYTSQSFYAQETIFTVVDYEIIKSLLLLVGDRIFVNLFCYFLMNFFINTLLSV